VLDDDAHRLAEDLAINVVGAQQHQRTGPVNRLGNRRRLLEVEVADLANKFNQLPGDCFRKVRRLEADDVELVISLGLVNPEVEAAALECLSQFTRVVTVEQHDRHRLGLQRPQLRH
jgi:hypothetical protein